MLLNIPNLLTLFRLISIPIILILYHYDFLIYALILMILSLITDFFDGYLARKLRQETHFGAIFDPIVDKFVGVCFYSYLLYFEIMPWWFCLVIILRNFSQILSIPILIWWLKISFKVSPSKFAKWVTAISDIFLFVPYFILPFVPIQSSQLTIPMMALALCELIILFTYLPRLVQIATGKHDTFT